MNRLLRTLRPFMAILLIIVIAVGCMDDDEEEGIDEAEILTPESTVVDTDPDVSPESDLEEDVDPTAAGEPTEVDGTPEATEEMDPTTTTEMTTEEASPETTPDEATQGADASPTTASAAEGATIAEILDQPEEYEDEQVIVDGIVERIIANGAFTVASEDGGDQTILVAGAGEVFPGIDEGSYVRLRGIVTTFDVNDERLNAILESIAPDESDAILAEYEDQPYIALDQAVAANVSVQELIESSEPFIDQEVTVTGPIVELTDDGAFLMGFPVDGENLLVVDVETDREDDLEMNDLVQVTGTVRNVDPAEIEQEFGVDLDAAFTRFEAETMIVADTVSVADETD